MEHVRDDLSAYLDGALAPAQRLAVDTHLAACPLCSTSLAELRTTARLVSALPLPAPARHLVPALAPRTNWMRPLRSLSAVATGLFVLLFMASATLETGFRMGGGGSTASSGRLIGGPTPAAAAFEARTDTASGSAPALGAAGSPGPLGSAQRSALPSAEAAKAAGPGTPAADQVARQAPGTRPASDVEPVRLGSPWLWLGLALLSVALAGVAHRRLRVS